MIQVARILCPVDFSTFSRHALDHAAALAAWYDATLTVLYVAPNRALTDLPALAMDDAERAQLMEELRRFTAGLPPAVVLDLRVQEAPDVSREILAQAAALPADLLVLGSHGRSGFERLMLGSVAEKAIRKAPCPTLLVPRRAPDVPPDRPITFRTVLCAVDFSEASRRGLAWATSLAGEADAALVVLHALEVPPELQVRDWPVDIDVNRIRAEAEASALQRLRALVSADLRTAGNVTTLVSEGAAYREILRASTERAADLIVMGVQGRGAIDLMVFGSNSARVMRAADCPVLIVPQA